MITRTRIPVDPDGDAVLVDDSRRAAAPNIPADDREAIARLPNVRTCECDGTGFVYRYRTAPELTMAERSVPLLCPCPMGRYLERTLRETLPAVRGRLRDLNAYPWLRGERYRLPPAAALEPVNPYQREWLARVGRAAEGA